MAEVVAGLHTADGRVAVKGFYDQVRELPAAERAAIAALPFNEGQYLAEIGAPATFGEPAYSTLERQWIRPTIEINGMWGGYQGPGSKTVLPAEARAKITCRLVPEQDPRDILDKVISHLEHHVPPGVRLSIRPGDHDAQPYGIEPDHYGLQIAREVLQEVYGKPPVIVRTGGTLPVVGTFKRILDLDTVFFSFSTADEDFHAPNEFFRMHRLHEGLEAWALYWDRLGARS
jgi:acetylornithine deacetylase/succinyl-diaminopimelate desuccinylase-like protein